MIATAIVYGLSLVARLTSAAGDGTEHLTQATRSASPVTSIMIDDGAQLFYKDWSPTHFQPVGFRPDWPLATQVCRTGCARPMRAFFVSNRAPP